MNFIGAQKATLASINHEILSTLRCVEMLNPVNMTKSQQMVVVLNKIFLAFSFQIVEDRSNVLSSDMGNCS